MPSERIQRQIDRLLDEAEAAGSEGDWQLAGELTRRVLTLDLEPPAGRNHPSHRPEKLGGGVAPGTRGSAPDRAGRTSE